MLKRDRPPEKEKGGGFFNKILRKVDGCDIAFHFDGKDDESKVVIDDPYDKTSERMHLFNSKDVITGKVQLNPKGSNFKHMGIVIEFIGLVTTLGDREDKKEFIHQEKHVEADTLCGPSEITFKFDAPKEYESYRGINAKVQYLIKLTIQRSVKNVVETEEIWVSREDDDLSNSQPDSSEQPSYFREKEFGKSSVSMDVGVDQSLHIEFMYNRKVFHLKDRILGKVTFKLMDLDIQHGEVGIVRKEFIGPGNSNDPVEHETLQKFEIMDGSPHKGEVLPIRLYLDSIPLLTPTYKDVCKCFRVKYYVNLVLVTGEGKRYYKQQEITLYRRTGQLVPSNSQVF